VQEAILRRFVADRGWTIVPDGKVWRSALSGRTVARADFEEILAFIKAHRGLVQYYVFRAIDRATRAGSSEYDRMKMELAKCGVQMVDTYGVIQPTVNTLDDVGFRYEWSEYSPSEISEKVIATTSKQEATTILTRLIGQEIRLTQQGYRTRAPIDGYLTQRIHVEGKKRTIMVPDPARKRFFLAMFELRAEGLSWQTVVDRVNAMGFRSKIRQRWNRARSDIVGTTGNKPLTIKQLQRIVQSPIYAGVLCEKWTHYKPLKARYPGLVSVDLWNRANRGRFALQMSAEAVEVRKVFPKTTGTVRNRYNPLFPFKFIRCPRCRREMWGSEPRGRGGKVPYYHCCRGHAYLGIPKADFDKDVTSYFEGLSFDPRVLPVIEANFRQKYEEETRALQDAKKRTAEHVLDLKAEQDGKIDAFAAATSPVIREKLQQDVDDLEKRIRDTETLRRSMSITPADIDAFVGQAKWLLEHPSEILLDQENQRLQRELVSLVFDDMPTITEVRSGTPKLSYVFRVSRRSEEGSGQLVHPLSLNWNLIEARILRWKAVFDTFQDLPWVPSADGERAASPGDTQLHGPP
jgi:hypothetical protein